MCVCCMYVSSFEWPLDTSQSTCLFYSGLPSERPLEQLGMKTDQVVLHQVCSVERRNEFQEAEHANKFIIPAWFRSNYHFTSKAIQDWVAFV